MVIIGASLSTVLIIILIIVAAILRKLNTFPAAVFTLTKKEVEEFYLGDRNYDVLDGNFQPEKLPYKEDLKIRMKELEIKDTVLGSGQFGIVHHGKYRNQKVAIKSCKSNADQEYFKAFLKEIKIMAGIGEHANIVKFIGAVTEDVAKGKCLAVFELSPFGNLQNYLQIYSVQHVDESRNAYVDLGDELELQGTLQVDVLVYFCKQIAQGMQYLAEKKVFHGDLATRNVLVFEKYVVKVTDFGMSRKLYDYAAYTKKTQVPLPWAWMALESLRFTEFSTQTDVWSFGVTMWEIFSMGQVPFSGTVWTPDFADQVEAGLRLAKPVLAPGVVYNFMLTCWENNPQNRPVFTECMEFFSSLEPKSRQN